MDPSTFNVYGASCITCSLVKRHALAGDSHPQNKIRPWHKQDHPSCSWNSSTNSSQEVYLYQQGMANVAFKWDTVSKRNGPIREGAQCMMC
ncbi:hypothetical protein VNO77_37283 [Canavalia gladiata]|uniref:Uncharacterized protein n=1 Tax=Canavalia gladiata TaxID=3824 RepID=A0AAN9KBB3_CANGL